MAAPGNRIEKPERERLLGQINYQLTKYFARRSGVMLTGTSVELLARILQRAAEAEGGDAAVERLVAALREENSGYTNSHFPE